MSNDQVQEAAATEAPKRTRKKSDKPRQAKPLFLILEYADEAGNPVKLDKTRLVINHTKDPAQVIDLMEGGGNQTVVTIRIQPEERPSPSAA